MQNLNTIVTRLHLGLGIPCVKSQRFRFWALLFTLYLLLFGQIINIFKITYHLFVDDIQLLFSVIRSEAVRLSTRDRPINGMADKYIK